MNNLQAPQILARAGNCFYIQLDSGFNVKAANEYFLSFFAVQHILEKPFLSLFPLPLHDRWHTVLNSIDPQHSTPCTLETMLVADRKTFNICWNICCVQSHEHSAIVYELLGVAVNNAKKTPVNNNGNTGNDEYCCALFDFHPEGVSTTNLEGIIKNVNTAFATLSGYSADELQGKPFISLIEPNNAAVVSKCLEDVSAGKFGQTGASMICKSEKKILVSVSFLPVINNGQTEGINIISRNITDQETTRLALAKHDAKLKSVLGKLNKILDNSLDMICVLNSNGSFLHISAASKNILGYDQKELLGKNFVDFVHKEDAEKSVNALLEIKGGADTTNFENRYYKKYGSIAHLVWSLTWEEADKRFYGIARDASEKKASEEALRSSEEKYRILFYNHPLPMWIYDTDTFEFIEINQAAVDFFGYSEQEFLNMHLTDILTEKEIEKFRNYYKQEGFGKQAHHGLWMHRKKNNQVIHLEITTNVIDYKNRNAKLVLSIDRTEKIKADEELIKSNERYQFLSMATFDAIWDWDLVTGHVQWNEGVNNLFDMPDMSKLEEKNWWYNHLHDEDRDRVIFKLNQHIDQNNTNWEDEYRFKTADDKYLNVYDRAYTFYDEHHKAVRMIGAMQNLTERKAQENMLKKLNNSLEKRAKELAESNAELERFAYVASHDLQEPLRMVTSFLQLLEKRYRDKLDKKAHEYIDYAVDGAERMKRLILDLLEYSRVNSSALEKEDVDLNDTLKDLNFTYKSILSDSRGNIFVEQLPVVKGNKTQLMQLFLNLISNAFKYRSNEPPDISIRCVEEAKSFRFSVTDNGIGIDPKFFNKIFIIFQRLHNREQYSGTGIGLAICKKIVNKHGGKIWVESMPGQGSTFYFTLPKSK